MKTKSMQVITVGSHVELNLVDRQGKKDNLSLDIVTDEAADVERGFLGAGTPLAKVLLGEKAGVVIPYLKDDIFAIEVLGVTGSMKRSPEDSLEKRQAKMMKTLREVEHTSAVMFASSFSGKWGDYDPASLPEVDQPAEGDAGDDLTHS
jgi:hypothetical protein